MTKHCNVMWMKRPAINNTLQSDVFYCFSFDVDNDRPYSVGIYIGRDGTDECYAISSYSNTCYAKIANGAELRKEVSALLLSLRIFQ